MNATMTQSKISAPADIIDLLRQTLHSTAYATRLETIHEHYHNSKNEARNRDALLEEFNASPMAKSHSLRAYAEADKVDMVVTRPGMHDDGWVRVELKYQFAFDLACRVRSTLDKLKKDSSGRTVRQQLDTLPGGDLKRIALDCIGKESDSEQDLCDVFVLIVQDRFGATHPEAIRSQAAHTKSGPWHCPELDVRGVTLQFLHEQMSLDARHGRSSYHKAWTEPTWELLELIHGLRPFSLQVVARTMKNPTSPFRLTSYLFTLYFTAPVSQPANAQAFANDVVLHTNADQVRHMPGEQSAPTAGQGADAAKAWNRSRG
jgi:hypothetical protein